MIISRTPFRVSFFGGGTDYPIWYQEHGGAVISTTIDKYCFVTLRHLPPFFDYSYRIRYYLREETKTIDEIQHPSVRECLRLMKNNRGIEMVHHADLPAQSGLGSSSTFTVSLLHALYTLQHQMPTKRELALNALQVEQKMIGENVGSQDQVAAAFGGLNHIQFGGANEFMVTPIILSPEKTNYLSDHFLLFFTGLQRFASEIAAEQIKETKQKTLELREMQALTEEAYAIFTQSYSNQPLDDLDKLGELLHQQWMLKRTLSRKISNSVIDDIYKAGCAAGAIGGKLLGAGGGGFVLFYAKPEYHENIKQALKHLLYVPFRFDTLGSQIIYYSHSNF